MKIFKYTIFSLLLFFSCSSNSQTIYSQLCFPDTSCLSVRRAEMAAIIDNHYIGDIYYIESYYYPSETDSSVEQESIRNKAWIYLFNENNGLLEPLESMNTIVHIGKHSPLINEKLRIPNNKDSIDVVTKIKYPKCLEPNEPTINAAKVKYKILKDKVKELRNKYKDKALKDKLKYKDKTGQHNKKLKNKELESLIWQTAKGKAEILE